MTRLKFQLGEDVFEAEGDLPDWFINRAFFVWLQLQSQAPDRINQLAEQLDAASSKLDAAVKANTPKP